jgi:hypothetical protein
MPEFEPGEYLSSHSTDIRINTPPDSSSRSTLYFERALSLSLPSLLRQSRIPVQRSRSPLGPSPAILAFCQDPASNHSRGSSSLVRLIAASK